MRAFTYSQRLALLTILAGAAALLVVGRLFTLQVVEHGRMVERAASHRFRQSLVRPRRGPILDAQGRVLACDDLAYDLEVLPRSWRDPRYECRHCGLVYQVAEGHGESPPVQCVRCRRRPDPDRDPGPVIVRTDARAPESLAALLRIPTRDLVERVEARVARAEKLVARRLAELGTHRSRGDEEELWYDYGRRPVTIARGIPYEAVREVVLQPRRHPAFQIRPSSTRVRTGGAAFVHILGATRTVEEELPLPRGGARTRVERTQGRNGLEAEFDEALRGHVGWVEIEVDQRTRRKVLLAERPATPGATIQLTIDADVQQAAFEAIAPREGAFVLLDAQTGAVLALATSPSYEPEEYGETVERWVRYETEWRAAHGGLRGFHGTPLINRACDSAQIPGSVLKPITALAAARGGVLDPAEFIPCDGYFYWNGRPWSSNRCSHAHGEVDLHGALEHSCNVYFQTLFDRLRRVNQLPAFYRTGSSFGFDERTGLEVTGSREQWSWGFEPGQQPGHLVATGIGQGNVLLTPAQVARAYAGLATGRLPRLHLVRRIGDRETAPQTRALDADPEVLELVRTALREVPVHGTAARYGLQRFDIACKTGTAQLGRSGPERGLQNAWLAGFAPARAGRPPIAFAMVVLNTPLNGGEECGPRLRQFLETFYREGRE